MKTSIKSLFLLPALMAGFGLILAGRVMAQTFSNLHSFNSSDGSHLQAGVIRSGNVFYGAADSGGDFGNGTVFSVNVDGSGFTNLYHFTGGSDGSSPDGTLVLSSNTLYGTAFYGGSYGNGTIYGINTNGTGFTNVYSFIGGSDGANPEAGLILSGNTLYGMTQDGGIGNGVVFAVSINGTGFTNLHTFSATSGSGSTNSDGRIPGGLCLSGNRLYGTAILGGPSGGGVVFAMNTNGTGFTNVHVFPTVTLPANPFKTNAASSANGDGALPSALVVSGNMLYGTAFFGGSSGRGTVYAINTDGTGFTNIHNFTTTAGSGNTNSDGANPLSAWSLVLSGSTLYGTTYYGGDSGSGTIFGIKTDGTGFTNLYSFTTESSGTNTDGANPESGLTLSVDTLYGTAKFGGSYSYGTVFGLSLGAISRPRLTISRSGVNVLLTWPTNTTGFSLEATTNISSPAIWSTNLPSPVVINGQNAVTNPITGGQHFFRLKQ